MTLTARIPRNKELQIRLITEFGNIIAKEGEETFYHDGLQIINALLVMVATVAYRHGAKSNEDVSEFADSVQAQTAEALTFMIGRGK